MFTGITTVLLATFAITLFIFSIKGKTATVLEFGVNSVWLAIWAAAIGVAIPLAVDKYTYSGKAIAVAALAGCGFLCWSGSCIVNYLTWKRMGYPRWKVWRTGVAEAQ
jgi:hypothetical protein